MANNGYACESVTIRYLRMLEEASVSESERCSAVGRASERERESMRVYSASHV